MATQAVRISGSNPSQEAGRLAQNRLPAPKPSAIASQPQDSSRSSTKKVGPQKRKRTKTGCLTCRKRRIKCDETQPICQNCMRSRRLCEGYKNPLMFRNSSVGPYSFNHGYNHALEDVQSYYRMRPPTLSAPCDPRLHPLQQVMMPFSGAMPFSISEAPIFNMEGLAPQGLAGYSTLDGVHYYPPRPPFIPAIPPTHNDPYGEDMLHPTPLPINGNPSLFFIEDGLTHSGEEDAALGSTMSSLSPSTRQGFFEIDGIDDSLRLPTIEDPDFHYISTTNSVSRDGLLQWPVLPATYDPEATVVEEYGYCNSPEILAADPLETALGDEGLMGRDFSKLLEEPLVKDEYPRALGVHSNIDFVAHNHTPHPDTILAIEAVDPSLDLNPFQPMLNNALDDPYIRSLFQHFVTTSGSLLTIFDRSSHMDVPILDQIGRPFTYPGLFTYTLPMLALQNQGLLHAILAMASLHIAKGTGASTTPSLKHYSYSLRRVHSAVRTGKERHSIETLGSTLILAFYEVATADHSKWNTHLSGACQLIREIDFAGMTRQLRCMLSKQNETNNVGEWRGRHQHFDQHQHQDPLLNNFSDFDPAIFDMLTGKKLTFDQHGNILREGCAPGDRTFSRADLNNYEVLRDLYWWYVRQDIIHAMVGGMDLLLDYDEWVNCPPRAPIGQVMAHYGSMDHLWLLIGRLLRFIYKDRKRKILMSKGFEQTRASNEGNTGPLKGTPPSSSTKESIIRPAGVIGPKATHTNGTIRLRAPPPFYGMAPTLGTPPMPEVFQNPSTSATKNRSSPESLDLETANAEAWGEWQSIRAAFDAFAQALGPDYEPLPEALHPSFDTPFGRAIHYRTHGIACVWGWYYAGLIVALRAHPSMPPYATISIGAAAQKTAQLANTIGRVVAGIHPDVGERPRRPTEAGAATDSTVALFFAAVQYQNPEQRNWTIRWLRDAEALSGWDSIGLCAHGCESAWVRAHEMGRGPAYTRIMGFDEEEEVTKAAASVVGTQDPGNGMRASTGTGFDTTSEPQEPGVNGFRSVRRGEQVMRSYSLYAKTTEEMAKMSLVGEDD